VQRLGMGSIPRSIVVLLLHDLVNACKPGDDVVITGVSMFRWGNTYKDERVRLETVIRANTVYVANNSSGTTSSSTLTEAAETEFGDFWQQWNAKGLPYTARNAIVRSICPQLYGLFMVKLTLLLTLIGSPAYADKSGNRVRGQPHLLLIGDPGTGQEGLMRCDWCSCQTDS
jgi:DNA helicase MCM9